MPPIIKAAGVPLLTPSGVPATSDYCCCGEDCVICDSGTPKSVRIEFTGMADGSCSDCNDYNTTTFELGQYATNDCRWRATYSKCSYSFIDMYVSSVNPSIHVEISSVSWIRFFLNGLGSTFDCFANRSVPYDASAGTTYCDGSSATAEVFP